ncbi:MAG: N-acyl homoserine lactonase family protein [Hyphomonadaceae bacterium]|nr:N-acyl homoserine lactonase family protein [Hyphomonadaceae bacterium]
MRVLLPFAVSVLALAACGQGPIPNEGQPPAQTTAAAPAGVALYALDCGQITVTDADAFSDDGSFKGVRRDFVDPCYLVRHPGGDLLWDSGIPDALADTPDGVTQEVFIIKRKQKLVDQLAVLNLKPVDIEYFSISHSHFDHVGNGGLLADSTFLIDKEERDFMFRPEAKADTQTFQPHAALENAKTTLIEGDGDFDVFGDGSVLLIAAPGHTPGHRVLLVKLASGPVLLTGDMFHLAESRARRTVPRFNTDRAQTLQSIDKLEQIARDTGARVVRQHVPEDFAALPPFPEALR